MLVQGVSCYLLSSIQLGSWNPKDQLFPYHSIISIYLSIYLLGSSSEALLCTTYLTWLAGISSRPEGCDKEGNSLGRLPALHSSVPLKENEASRLLSWGWAGGWSVFFLLTAWPGQWEAGGSLCQGGSKEREKGGLQLLWRGRVAVSLLAGRKGAWLGAREHPLCWLGAASSTAPGSRSLVQEGRWVEYFYLWNWGILASPYCGASFWSNSASHTEVSWIALAISWSHMDFLCIHVISSV